MLSHSSDSMSELKIEPRRRRLKILEAMDGSWRKTGDIAEDAGVPISAVCDLLKTMEKHQLVKGKLPPLNQKSGKWKITDIGQKCRKKKRDRNE